MKNLSIRIKLSIGILFFVIVLGFFWFYNGNQINNIVSRLVYAESPKRKAAYEMEINIKECAQNVLAFISNGDSVRLEKYKIDLLGFQHNKNVFSQLTETNAENEYVNNLDSLFITFQDISNELVIIKKHELRLLNNQNLIISQNIEYILDILLKEKSNFDSELRLAYNELEINFYEYISGAETFYLTGDSAVHSKVMHDYHQFNNALNKIIELNPSAKDLSALKDLKSFWHEITENTNRLFKVGEDKKLLLQNYALVITAFDDILDEQIQKYSELQYEKLSRKAVNITKAADLFTIIFILSAIILFIIITRSITKPLIGLAEHTKIIGKGKFEAYKEYTDRKDEIGQLVTAFNKMTGDIKQITTSRNLLTTEMEARKKVENDLRIALTRAEESDRLKSAFLANVSHEIRTPMNGILGFSELLNSTDLESKEAKDYIQVIQKSGNRMLNIISDLIDIAKIEAGQLEINYNNIDITQILEYVCSFFKPVLDEKNIEINYLISDELKYQLAISDEEKIKSVLINLVRNAIKYTNKGNIKIDCSLKDKNITFCIKDTGIGLNNEHLEKIFDRFVQADLSLNKPYEGAGLGLSISKAYIEKLGGKIWAKSEGLGKGSEFYFNFPFNPVADKIQPDRKEKITDFEKIKDLNILAIDDDNTSLLLLSNILEKKCSRFIAANSADEGINILKKDKNINLILMDIKMTQKSGMEATREIRTFNKSIIIIAQSAHAYPDEHKLAIEAGCNDYIVKPIITKLLISKINQFFNPEIA